MDSIPKIRLVFMLTKNDTIDFDREAVRRHLGIEPSKTNGPIFSKGILTTNGEDIHEVQKRFVGITLVPHDISSYRMLKHATWSIELPKTESWSLDEPLHKLETLFAEKKTNVLRLCKEYDLRTDLTIRVFAKSNNMPDLIISNESLSFWAAMGTTINFDFYLD